MAKLDTAPYKGVRDFYPDDLRFRKWLFGKLRGVVEKYGYVEYDASILEPSELYKAKTGEEIVNGQTYTFIDRGDREVTLRPEMTPTVARMVAGKRRELGFPLRWYSIPNLFRYEAPQRGRLREHYQLNVDIFGDNTVNADIEIISIAYDIMKSLGAKDDSFEIRINDRKSLKALGISEEQEYKFSKLLDRKSKISQEEFENEREKILGDTKLELQKTEKLNDILKALGSRGIGNAIYDQSIIRGFDYYTDIVFEVFDTSGENTRSLFGGGRYDNLLDLFGNDEIPAVGFGMGDLTLRDFIETHGLMPELKSETQVAVFSFGNTDVSGIANTLREAGINTFVDSTDKDISDKKRNAEKNGIPSYIVVGENEISSQKFELKNASNKDIFSGSISEMISELKGR